MTLEDYKNILRTGTPSDRARAIAEAGNDRSLTDEEFHELTAMIKGVVRPPAAGKTAAGNNCEFWPDERVGGNRRRGCGHGNAVPLRPGRLQDRGRSAGCAGRGCIGKTAEGNGGDDTSAASAGGTAGSEPQTGALCAAAFGSRGAAACGNGNFIGAQLP